jgi:hypothetical protein
MPTTKEGYPPSDFLVVEDLEKASTFHLQVKRHGKPDHGLMGAAWAALHSGYRGNQYEGPDKEAALSKLKALYRSEGMEWPSETSREDSGFRIQDSGPRFVVQLAEISGTGLIRIPIAVTGTWAGAEKKFSIELEDLEQIRENFAKKPTGEINVDYEHASEVPFGTGGPVLSAGRVVNLDPPETYRNGKEPQSEILRSAQNDSERARSDKAGSQSPAPSPQPRFILWGWYEPTERARELIANREYRYISPAIRWGTKDKVTGKTVGTALTSVALVNKPFLEELPEIHLCEVQEEQVSGARCQVSGEKTPRTFVSLQQLHVPGPVNQVSVAYQQPGNREQGSGIRENQKSEIRNEGEHDGKESHVKVPH